MNALPSAIVSMLRGDIGYTDEWKDVAEIGRDYYTDGKAGRGYTLPPLPEVSGPVVRWLDSFLRKCYAQGQQDAEEAQT